MNGRLLLGCSVGWSVCGEIGGLLGLWGAVIGVNMQQQVRYKQYLFVDMAVGQCPVPWVNMPQMTKVVFVKLFYLFFWMIGYDSHINTTWRWLI